jgi:hypothetical protein
MKPEDAKHFSETPPKDPVQAIDAQPDSHPPPKTGTAERKEQASFANWLLLQNSKGRLIPFVWHSTHTRSRATPGTPDFWVGINRRSIWFEFKRDYSSTLSPEQDAFRLCCVAQQIEWYVVYSAHEAIKFVEDADAILCEPGEQYTKPFSHKRIEELEAEVQRLIEYNGGYSIDEMEAANARIKELEDLVQKAQNKPHA